MAQQLFSKIFTPLLTIALDVAQDVAGNHAAGETAMKRNQGMTVEQIKAAVDAGQKVHWSHEGYTVIKDNLGQYLIAYDRHGPRANYIGLTWQDGTTLNGKPEQFFIARSNNV